jgi:hypothetical protein
MTEIILRSAIAGLTGFTLGLTWNLCHDIWRAWRTRVVGGEQPVRASSDESQQPRDDPATPDGPG